MDQTDAHWRSESLTRIPYGIYSDAGVAADEQAKIFRGETWNYLCLDIELAETGSYRTTFVGETPVIVVRDADGEVYAFENRCAHRGALIALEKCGRAEDFQCVYHAWTYNRQGDLKGVAFEKGVGGKGGMSSSFNKEAHGPRKLRVAVFHGLVFGSFSEDVLPIEEYLGEEVAARVRRVMCKPVEIIGRFSQALPNNWKLYVENTKDTYHASLLHMFFTTFQLNKLSQKGGIIVDESGGHHVSYSMVAADDPADTSYKDQALRSENETYRLRDPSLLAGFRDFDDGVTLQIICVFPGFVLQQIQNCLAVRQILPKSIDRTELNWVYFGYTDDTADQRLARLKQANLMGPAGFVSMEDGAVGGFVQRGIAGAHDHEAIVEMGGTDAASSESRATETSVRGFWKSYRQHMHV